MNFSLLQSSLKSAGMDMIQVREFWGVALQTFHSETIAFYIHKQVCIIRFFHMFICGVFLI